MRKIISIIIVGIFLSSPIVISGSEKDNKTINIYEINTKQDFFDIEIKKIENFTSIELSKTDSYLMEAGKPVLPIYEKTYTFPLNTKIKNIEVKKENIEKIVITDNIRAAPTPQSSISSHNTKNDYEKVELDEIYPDKDFEYRIGRGIHKNERSIFLKLIVYPVRYNPNEKNIEIAKNVEITIEYEKTSNSASFNNKYSFLILTPAHFIAELNDLMIHKNNRGVSTKIVSLHEIYNDVYFPSQGRDEPEKIKYFIKNAIEEWGIKNVMFVGGALEFPTRNTHVFVDYHDGDDEIFVCDLYYADIYDNEGNFSCWDSNENDVFGEYDWNGNYDDVDLFPDVYYGRLAATNKDTVEAVVNKIITYESNEAWRQDWFSTMVVIGGDTFPGDEKGINEGEYMNQASLDHMTGFIPDKIWDSNKRLSGISPSGLENINTAIENGCGFLDWAGHGSTNVWTTYPHKGSRQSLPTPWGSYYNYHIMNLNNEEKLPIVFTGACSVGKFNTNSNCFTWSFVNNPNGGGIASIGPSGLAWAYTGIWVTQGLSGKIQVGFYKAFSEGAYTFGEMHTKSVIDYISPNMDGGDHKTIQQFTPFGDPTLQIQKESEPPFKPEMPSGERNGKIGEEYTYTTITTDPDGDDIYYRFDWGDETYSSWIGPVSSGTEVQATHTWNKQGEYEIRAQARDEHGKISEWSDTNPVSMPANRNNKRFSRLLQLFENIPILKTLFELLEKIII